MLQVNMLGSFGLNQPEPVMLSNLCRTSIDLLGYLAVNRKAPQRREKISEILWPDRDEAQSRSALSTALWRISKSLSTANLSAVLHVNSHDRSTLSLAASGEVCIDCIELEDCVAGAVRQQTGGQPLATDVQIRMSDALENWRGDFLEGSRCTWAIREQERFRTIRVRGLTLLMRNCATQGLLEQSLQYGLQILAMDELREATQREVMWLYLMNGQRCEAIQRYRQLKDRLREELDVAPMPETEAVYQFIRDEVNTTAHWRQLPIAELLQDLEAQRGRVYAAIAKGANLTA